MEKWIKKMWYTYTYTMEYYLAIKEGNLVICNNVDVPWEHYDKWNKSVQSLRHVRLFSTPWTAARQASLSFSSSQSLFKLIVTESVMPSSHLTLCHPLLLLSLIFLSIMVFSNEPDLRIRCPKYWSFNFSIGTSASVLQWIFRVDFF